MVRSKVLSASVVVGATVVSLVVTGAAPVMAARGTVPPPNGPGASPGAEGDRGARMGDGIRRVEGGGDRSRSMRAPTGGVEGVDVSAWQPAAVDWKKLWDSGNRFAFVKATESDYWVSDRFRQQFTEAKAAGLITGAYHYAVPSTSSGSDQAAFFLAGGGAWTGDGKTLPGALDLEWGTPKQGGDCYGKSPAEMAAWVEEFNRTYKAATGRDVILYTSTAWWNQCVGLDADIAATHHLWIPRYASEIGALPNGWTRHAFWQYTDGGETVGDHNNFNGTESDLRAMASGDATMALVDTDSGLYQGARLEGRWTDFVDVQSEAGSIGDVRSVGASVVGRDTHVVALGGDGRLHHAVRRADGTWTRFGDVNGQAGKLTGLGAVSVASVGAELHVVAAAQGKPYHCVRRADGTWTVFGDVTGEAGRAGDVSSVATAATGGRLHVTALAKGKTLHTIRAADGHWDRWGDVAGQAGSRGDVASATMTGVGEDVHVTVATDGGRRQYHTVRRADGTWQRYGDLGDVLGTLTARSVGAASVDGEFQLAVVTGDKRVLHTIRSTSGHWSATKPVGLAGTKGTPHGVAVAGMPE
ncbi:GH25 family lysozyme [Streptomyces sp. IBSNAI002]|uniref:GH25 family lysozyme n=1 Tax=Streptomyces sp. IBSNAI002 TaxID=3457500 RepID=UPI003FD52CB6